MSDEPASYLVLSRISQNAVTAWSPELKHDIRTLQVAPEDNVGPGDYIILTATEGLYEKMDNGEEPSTGIKTTSKGSYVTVDTVITAFPADFFIRNLPELREMGANGVMVLSFDLGVVYTTKKYKESIQVGKIYKATVVDHRILLESTDAKVQQRLEKQLSKIGSIWSVIGDMTEVKELAEIVNYENLINESAIYDYTFEFARLSSVRSSSNVLARSEEENVAQDIPRNSHANGEVRNIVVQPVTINSSHDIQDTIDKFCASFDNLPIEQRDLFTATLYKILSNQLVFQALKEEMNYPEDADQLYNHLRQMHSC